MKIFDTKHVRTLLLVFTLLVVAGEFFSVYYAKKLRDAYSNGASKSWIGRPSLIENGDVWISVYRKANRHEFDPQSTLHIRFSQDEGITWTPEDMFLDGHPVREFPIVAHQSSDVSFAEVSEGTLLKTPNTDLLLFVREEGPPQNGTYVWRSNNGGASWQDEGKINNDNTLLMGGQIVSVSTGLYATFWVDQNADYEPPFKTVLYKSPDHGKSWIHVSDLSSRGTAESALVYLGGNEFLAVVGDDVGEKTYLGRSSDLGENWGELQDVADMLGVLGRPKLQMFPDEPNRLYLYGRDHIRGLGGYTVLYYSDNRGVTWSKKFYPGVIAYPDTGYSTLLKRTDGNFYMLSYGGTSAWANIKEYIFGKSAIEEL